MTNKILITYFNLFIIYLINLLLNSWKFNFKSNLYWLNYNNIASFIYLFFYYYKSDIFSDTYELKNMDIEGKYLSVSNQGYCISNYEQA